MLSAEHLVARKKRNKPSHSKQLGIKKHLLLFYRTWCFYWLLFVFLVLLFHFARWGCVAESMWHLAAERKGTKAVTERCFQGDNARNAWKERNQIGDLCVFDRSSGGSWRAAWKWKKSQRSRAALKLLHTPLFFLFQGLRTLHLHQVVFSLKGN